MNTVEFMGVSVSCGWTHLLIQQCTVKSILPVERGRWASYLRNMQSKGLYLLSLYGLSLILNIHNNITWTAGWLECSRRTCTGISNHLSLDMFAPGSAFCTSILKEIKWTPSVEQVTDASCLYREKCSTTFAIIDGSEIILETPNDCTSNLQHGATTNIITQLSFLLPASGVYEEEAQTAGAHNRWTECQASFFAVVSTRYPDKTPALWFNW